MPPKGVDQPAREAMTNKIAQRLTTLLKGQNMIDAARQIEAKCYDSAKDATDYKRKVEKRLAKAAKALEASQRPSMSEPSDTAPLEKKQALARKRSREDPEVVRRPDASLIKTTRDVVTERLCSRNLRTLCPGQPDWGTLLQEAKRTGAARDLLREHGATLEWWRGAPAVIGRRLRSIIDAELKLDRWATKLERGLPERYKRSRSSRRRLLRYSSNWRRGAATWRSFPGIVRS